MTEKKNTPITCRRQAAHFGKLATMVATLATSFVGTAAHAWAPLSEPLFDEGFLFVQGAATRGGACEFDSSAGGTGFQINWEDGGGPTFGTLGEPGVPGSRTITADTFSTGCLGGTPIETFSVNFDLSLSYAELTEATFTFCAVLSTDAYFDLGFGSTVIEGDGTAKTITYGLVGDVDAEPMFILEEIAHGTTSCPAAATANDPEEEVTNIINDDLLQTTIQTSTNASDISRRAATRLRRPAQGCEAQIAGLLNAQDIRFANDSFVIDARNDGILDSIANALGGCDDADFLIAGHTDWNASDAYNITLSQNRVDAVKAALVRRGVASDRLTTRGFGESQPIATNETAEGRAANRRVEFIQIKVDLQATGVDECVDGADTRNTLNAAGENGTGFLIGGFGTSVQNCATGTYIETWLDVDLSHADVLGTQARVSLGFSKEVQEAGKLRGYFVEGYAQRTSIDVVDDGSITGVGVHAGLFGAHAVETLTASYYASAAAGRHKLEFDADGFGDGHYTYFGVFLGGALTGERAYTSFTLRPSLGVDLGYGDSLSADIAGISDIEIDAARYARISGSFSFIRSVGTDDAPGTLAVNPRIFCETSSGTLGEGCGIGGSVDYDFASADSDHVWSLGAGYDRLDDVSRASAKISRSQSFAEGKGSSVSRLSMSDTGAPEIGHDLTYTW